jgi:hypothetical protein
MPSSMRGTAPAYLTPGRLVQNDPRMSVAISNAH